MADQALFAGSHFILNILLARWLTPTDYGAFALAYSIFLLAVAFHGALLLEPMVIFGSGRYIKARRSYLGFVILGHVVVTGPAAMLMVGAGALVGQFYSGTTGRALLMLGAVLPIVLLMWLSRRAFYVELQPLGATLGGLVYLGILVGAVVSLHAVGRLTVAAAILAMGGAAFVATAAQLPVLKPQWPHSRESFNLRTLARTHWQYGRWALATAVMTWVPANAYYPALAAGAGLSDTGALRALMNLANPAIHTLFAFSMLVTPALVRQRDQGGLRQVRSSVQRLLTISLIGAAAYFAVLWFLRHGIMRLLYSEKYTAYADLPVGLIGLLPVVTCCTVALGGALRAVERPDHVFWSYLVGSLVAVALGIPLAARAGLVGALLGQLLSYSGIVISMLLFYRRLYPMTES